MKPQDAAENDLGEPEILEVVKVQRNENRNLIPMDDFPLPTSTNILHHLTKIEKKLDDLSKDVGAVKAKTDQIELWSMDFNHRLQDVQRVAKITREQTEKAMSLGEANKTHLDNMQTEMKDVKRSLEEILTILKAK